jgi:hypothetical protein
MLTISVVRWQKTGRLKIIFVKNLIEHCFGELAIEAHGGFEGVSDFCASRFLTVNRPLLVTTSSKSIVAKLLARFGRMGASTEREARAWLEFRLVVSYGLRCPPCHLTWICATAHREVYWRSK